MNQEINVSIRIPPSYKITYKGVTLDSLTKQADTEALLIPMTQFDHALGVKVTLSVTYF